MEHLIDNEKRYNTLDRYLKYTYGKKVAKISLNAGFTCPNRTGEKGYGGCTYCSEKLSGDFAGNINKKIFDQFLDIKNIMEHKWPDSLYIPYLQAGSNTYASVEKLKEIYEPLTKLDGVVSISLATRADCFNDEIYEYLDDLNKRIHLTVELGLQTSNEKTGSLINRGMTNEEFVNCVNKLNSLNIEVVTHIINGLPYETKEDMLNTIEFVNSLPINGVKIHSLLILKDSKMYKDYLEKPFKILSLEEYVDITVSEIEHLRPDIIIHRLAADGSLENLVEPKWTIKKMVVMNEIDKLLRKKDSYQGILYKTGKSK